MRLAAVAWVANVLTAPTTGVNALVGSVPRLPSWPATPPVDVFDESRDLWVSSNTLPQQVLKNGTNGLIVRRMQQGEGDVLPVNNGFSTATIIVHFFARVDAGSTPRNDLAIIAEQTLVCVERCLNLALPQFVQATYPTLNGVEFGVPESNAFTSLVTQAPIEGGLLLDALVVRLSYWNGFALGVTPPSS